MPSIASVCPITSRVRGHVGLLDWYTVTLGIFTLVMLSAHGATYLTLKTEGTVHDRSLWLAGILWVTVCAGLVVISIETWFVRSELFGNMLHRPIAWLAVVIVLVGGAAIFTGIRSRMEFRAFAGSPARPACRSGYSADNSLFEMLCWMSVGIFPIIRGIDESTTFDVQGSLFESLWIDRSRSV
jgi:cytochrome bd-type quinol oxidase subunit 2